MLKLLDTKNTHIFMLIIAVVKFESFFLQVDRYY